MNIYISQVTGNESMAGCMSAMAIVLTIRYLQEPSSRSWHFCALIGLFLGLAILTKLTVVPLVPPLLSVIAYGAFLEYGFKREAFYAAFKRIIVVLGIAFLVSGGYFIRNWVELNSFFVTKSITASWWQYPGYRTMNQFLSFGESLFYPIYAAMFGIWDSLYSTFWMDGSLSGICTYIFKPPWNYSFMLSGAWLSLLPCIAMGVGAVASLNKPLAENRRIQFFSVLCAASYLFAILYLFLTVPIYSQAKATYSIGIIPCFAVLIAFGLDIMMFNRFMKSLIHGLIACWVVAVYAAYFIL